MTSSPPHNQCTLKPLDEGRVVSRASAVFRLGTINLLVVGALLLGLNLLSHAGLGAFRAIRATVDGSNPKDDRWTLPNYEGHSDRARLIFEEFGVLSTQYEPFIAWSRLPFQGVTTTVNAEGDRVHPTPDRDGEPHAEVSFFGGSTMWGTGADDDGTLPALFNRMYPELVVHNYGESGFNSRQGLDRLITLLTTGERIDLAVFLDGANDVSQQCRVGISVPGHGQMLLVRGAPIGGVVQNWDASVTSCIASSWRVRSRPSTR